MGLHAKPIIAVNVDGYWDPLMALMRHVVDEGFADASVIDMVSVVPDAGAALDALTAMDTRRA